MPERHSLRLFWALAASLLLHLLVISDLNALRWWQPFNAQQPASPLDVLLVPAAAPLKSHFNPAGKNLDQHTQQQTELSNDPAAEVLTPPPSPGTFTVIETPEPTSVAIVSASPTNSTSTENSFAATAVQTNEDKTGPHLPSSGKLVYRFYWGTARWLAGEAIHQWQINNGYYSLTSTVKTTGIFQWLHPVRLEETSKGKINGTVLLPLQFSTQFNDYPPAVAIFDWDKALYRWFRGKAAFNQALPKNSYDKISYLYQLYLAPRKERFFSVEITTGRRLEHYDIVNLGTEIVYIDSEALPAIHLQRATNSPEMEKIDIWLAASLNQLPLKMTYANQAGDHFEQLISGDSLPTRQP